MSDKASAGCGVPFVLIFVGFWTLVTGLFDVIIVWGAYRQTRAAATYATAPGVIRHSKVTAHSDDDGTTYGVEVKYAYWIDGREYVGDRYRYNDMKSSDGNAKQVVASLPVGTELPVYYNPSDPQDSVLKVGVEGMDLFMALFMTPFNIIMLGGWYVLVQGFIAWRRGGSDVLRSPKDRYTSAGPLAAGLGTVLMVSFVSVFAVVIPVGSNPPLWVIGGVWVLVLGAGLAAALYRWAVPRLEEA